VSFFVADAFVKRLPMFFDLQRRAVKPAGVQPLTSVATAG
jgi:hypothetical protein